MSFLKRFRWAAVGLLGRGLLWLWAKTVRLRVVGEEKYLRLKRQGKPVILLIWHGRILFAPYFFRRQGIMSLISPSQDGEIISQIVVRWGYKIIRGSSSHSIVRAWNEMKKELQAGGELIIVPDGPKGPDRYLKPGCLKLAQETGAFLVPFTFSASRKRHLKSWDRFLLVYPFSRVMAVYGQPLTVGSTLKGDALEGERRRVEKVLLDLDERADRLWRGQTFQA